MKKKILLLAATLLLSLSVAETATAQSAVQRKSYVTSSMARKITYFCQYKDLAMAIFADANEIVSGVELDKTINTLDKHLDCAENFFLAIYYRYGMEMGYGVLKNMGLTPREIEVVQAEWKKDDERTAVIAEQKRKEKERGYLKLIEGNGIFTTEQLSVQPEINIDLTSISWLLSDNPKSEPVNYWFHCIVNKDGYIYLQDESDTLRYTDTEKAIYNNYIKGYNAFVLGKVEIDGKQVRGSHFNAGEVGHLRVGVHVGVKCACGRMDCVEAIAAGIGFDNCARLLRDRYETNLHIPAEKGERVLVSEVYALSQKGDPLCVALVDIAAEALANLIMNLVRMTDPDTVVLGGGIVADGYMHEKILEKLQPITMRFVTNGVVITKLNPGFIGLLGAGAVAMNR